ncbi:MAG: hypothetical protein BLM47_07440 [Candidatus Reconcilbacillus cellulovorans]|uniref:SLH domain-containing protein n=1 Tax=Candidatus Reconcilbacillus cellulovorans TaxID=1906605 RepID=A0A2A6E018_9BACL|nr:MAG: hypothetical protein BLM47_07440 [Candidatus Reconcilbacillus cellulovorans]
MTLSAFAPVAFGAELTTEQKWQALVDAGIFDADGTGQGAQLDANMTRAQFTKVIVKLLGLQEVSDTPSFDDVKGHWAAGYIEAAKRAGLVDGVSDNPPLFAPDNEVTLEQLAKLVVEALDLEQSTDAVSGKVSDWAKGYVAAAVKAGLLPASSDYTVPAKREVLVTATYQAREIEEGKKVTKIESFKAVGAKKLEVKFSKAVDTSKAQVSLKKGSIQINIAKITYSDDKKTATIELVTNLTKGDYTVTVSGVEANPLQATVSVEDEKVSRIEFVGDKAPQDRNNPNIVYAWLKVYNQYNEEITKSVVDNNKLSVSSGYPTTTVDNTGKVTIQSNTAFLIDTKVTVSAVHKDTGVYAAATYTVATPARVADITIDKLYNSNGKTEIDASTDLNTEQFYLLVTAKDQYGNTVSDVTYIKNDVVVNVTNTSVINVDWSDATKGEANFTTVSVDGSSKVALRLKNGTPTQSAGVSQVFIYSKTTGRSGSIQITVKDSSKIDTLTLEAPALVVGGETVEIPYTALDQYGKEVTALSAFQALNVSVTQGTYSFEKDYATGKVKFKYSAPSNVTSSTTVYMTVQTQTFKFTQLQFTVQPDLKPEVISGVDELKYALAPGAKTTINRDKIKIYDQYGRSKTVEDIKGAYCVQLSIDSGANNVVPSGTLINCVNNNNNYTIDNNVKSIELQGTTNGSTTFRLKLIKASDNSVVPNSDYTFTVRTVKRDEIVGYEVADIPKLYANGNTDHRKALDVTGLLADGTKVAIPEADTSYYNVYVTGDLGYDSATDSVYANAWSGDPQEKTFTVVVTGNTNSGSQVITKSVVASIAPPEAATLELRKNGVAWEQGSGYVKVALANAANAFNVAVDAVKVTDQYGVEMTTASKFANVFVSNVRDVNGNLVGNGTSLQGLQVGWTYTVTAVTQNGKSISFKVIVQNP